MKPLGLDDILDIRTYETIRPDYRARVIAHKKQRRISVGPQMSLVFEDRETLRYQIQEMTRIERTTDPAKVQLEVDVYNDLIPRVNELSATLFIEIPELDLIQPALDRLVGIDEHVRLAIEGEEPVRARFDDRQMEEDRISAVHYIRFSLTPEQSHRFVNGAPAQITIDHPHYLHAATVGRELRDSLARDLQGTAPDLLHPERVRRSRSSQPDIVAETDHVRARRVGEETGPERVVVEPVDAHTALIDADPNLLTELFQLAQQIARELEAREGSAHVRLDLRANEPGRLRFEIAAVDSSRSDPLGLVLASASPRRRELLGQAGVPHEVMPADVDEQQQPGEPPLALVLRLAREKALAVAKRVGPTPRRLVLGADTIVVLDDRIYSKPSDAEDAIRHLHDLTGRTHRVITGVAVVDSESLDVLDRAVESLVTIRPASEAELRDYVETGEPLDKAGAYAIQGRGAELVSKLEGSLSNVIGLPVEETLELLTKAGHRLPDSPT